MSADKIDHYRDAEDTLEAVTFTNGSEQAHSYTDYALAEATLALAYEQRTANLIAYQANVERSYVNALKSARSEQASALNRQITERLGLA
jgi:hypothetical protein